MKKYDMPMDLSPDSIPGKIISRIAPGSSVLEFGCSYGRMTKYMKEHLQCEVCIVELDQEAFPVARQYAVDGYSGDIDQEGWYLHYAGRQFDRILFADVLEHLRDPLQALTRASSLLKEDGEIVISLPNIGHNDVLVKLFQNRFEYTPIGLLDNTHIHFWGLNNLEELARQAGFGIRVLDGAYQPAFHTEQQPRRQDTPSRLLDVLACRPYNEVYQFFLVFQKQAWMEQNALTCQDHLQKFYHTLSFRCRWASDSQEQPHQSVQLVPEVLPDGSFHFRCDAIPAGCRKVQLELTLGLPSLLNQIRVTADTGSCSLQPLNGALQGDVAAFSDPTPLLELSLPEGAGWFELSAVLHVYSGQEYTLGLSDLEKLAQAEAARLERADLERREAELRQQLEQAAQERLSLLDQLEEYRARCEVYREHSQWKDQKIAHLEQHQLHPHHQAQLEEMQANYNILAQQYNSIVHSQCWKITKPLRTVLGGVKRTSLGSLPYKLLHNMRTGGEQGASSTRPQQKASTPSQSPAASAPLLSSMAAQVEQSGGQVYHAETFLASDTFSKRKILLVSHTLNLTGAPIALGYFAKALQKQGDFPVLISPFGGGLCDQLEQEGLPILVYPALYESDLVKQYAKAFDAIVVCTIVGAPTVVALNGTSTPVLWWIHEAHASYLQTPLDYLPDTLEDNIHICAVCSYAERVMKQYLPNYQPRGQLLYSIPDYANQLPAQPSFRLRYAEGKLVFAIVGMQEQRKGQDILIQAIRQLDPEVRSKCLFVFVGVPCYKPIFEDIFAICEDFPRNTQYIEELNRTDMLSLYMQIDCLICASRDDPMPIVVTEAMLMSKAVICSENAGSAELLEKMNSGLVYHNDDPEELAQCIQYIYQHRGEDLEPMCRQARKTYERFFTQEVFEQQVADTMAALLPPQSELEPYEGKVSVVIPTFQAGEGLVPLLECLQSQQNIGSVEIVIVDSGSRDGTAERAEQMGAQVIRIPQSEFSHSYARNLGAEHASGDYLLFMTQDALPSGPLWICGLMQPVLHSGAVAVSCRESPRPNCDLMGRISIWTHSEYMGILEQDRLMQMPAAPDCNSIRYNGQLNDVTCLINRRLFLDFKYRGDYAEDLDLGIRLIKAGHTLALVSSVQVVHSHTRPALYHMKRALVDRKTLKAILPDLPLDSITAQDLTRRAVGAYCAMVCFYRDIPDCTPTDTWQSFYQWCEDRFSAIKENLPKLAPEELLALLEDQETTAETDGIQDFVLTLFQAYGKDLSVDMRTAEDVFFFLMHTASRYFLAHQITFDRQIRQEILDMLPKYMAQLFGLMMADYVIAHPQEQGVLRDCIERYSQGV